jgi:TolA-binding protein
MPQDVRNLAISGVISLVVGLVVYLLAGAEVSALRSRVTELSAQIQTLQASQASLDQRIGDVDLQQKATILRMDETAVRLGAVEKALTPPPAPEPAPVTDVAPAATPEAAPAAPAASAPAASAPAASAPGAPTVLVPKTH